MLLFHSSRNTDFAKKISKATHIPIGRTDFITFGDSELKPHILSDVRNQDVVIVTSTSIPVNENYMEFFLLVDALRRSACGRITAVMPYYGYARQNQQHLPGEPVSAMLMAKIIETVGVNEFVSIDLHEEQISGFFSIPVTHLTALPLLAQAFGEHLLCSKTSYNTHTHHFDHKTIIRIHKTHNIPVIVISPDQGGIERTRKFRDALAKQFDELTVDEEIGIVEKSRSLISIHQSKVVEITGVIKGKIAVIPDDVIVSGKTIINAAKEAKEKGATQVYVAATHADFIKGTKGLLEKSDVERVFVTDTIGLPESDQFKKLEIVSTIPLLKTYLKLL